MSGDFWERNGTFTPPETIKSIDNLLARDVKFICVKTVTSTWSKSAERTSDLHPGWVDGKRKITRVRQICPDLFG